MDNYTEPNLTDLVFLKKYLLEKANELKDDSYSNLISNLDSLKSVFPFNEYEYIISHLLGYDIFDIEEYKDIRQSYIDQNPFLFVYELFAPRSFGETWAQAHLKAVAPDLVKPSKRLDPKYSGQYDFLLDENIHIELKASRACDSTSNKPLYEKALSSKTSQAFWMNFQQVKTDCADVFVCMGIFTDIIQYWVLSADDLKNHESYSRGQHRGNYDKEGQIGITDKNIHLFKKFLTEPGDLIQAIRDKYNKQMKK